MRLPVTSKASTLVVSGRSTSVKTTPKPFVVAFVCGAVDEEVDVGDVAADGAEDLVAGEGLEARQVRRVEGAEAQRAGRGRGRRELTSKPLPGVRKTTPLPARKRSGGMTFGADCGVVDAVPADVRERAEVGPDARRACPSRTAGFGPASAREMAPRVRDGRSREGRGSEAEEERRAILHRIRHSLTVDVRPGYAGPALAGFTFGLRLPCRGSMAKPPGRRAAIVSGLMAASAGAALASARRFYRASLPVARGPHRA